MTRVVTPPPATALRAFLDEVVVPILVERFLREHGPEGVVGTVNDGVSAVLVTKENEVVSENVALRNDAPSSPFSGVVAP
jgi:hypothetical protein